MKIAFLQKYPFPYFGVMSISACLPEEYEREVFVGDLEDDPVSAVVNYRPDVLALPVMSTEYRWMTQSAAEIKRRLPSLTVVAGYIHATSCPEMVEHPAVDAVCVGEGEYSFPAFLQRLEETGRPEAVDGFRVKRDGKIIKPARPSLVPDLDALPDEDREIYYRKYPALRDEKLKQFIASRGCPYSCSFCCHQVYQELYRGKAKYVRRKSPQKVIREIRGVKERYGMESVCFLDDVFVLDLEWLKEFSRRYREEIGLPFFCAVTAPAMTGEVAALLRETGCHTVTFGVETANEKKRFEVLNKRVTNEQMIECARLVKKHGMKLQTTNIFGLPFETVEEAFENIRFNLRLGTDYMCSNILLPFPRSGIEKTALEAGILDPDYLESEEFRGVHLSSVLKYPGIEEVERAQKISHLAMKLPFLIPLFRRLVRIRSKKLFFGFFVISSMWRYKSEKPISWPEVMRMFWRARKNYLRYLS